MDGSPITDVTAQVDDLSEAIASAVEETPETIDKHTNDAIQELIGRIDAMSNTLGERLGEDSVRHSELVTMLNRVLERVENAPEEGEAAVKDAVEETQKVLDEIQETPVIQKKKSGMLMKRGRK